MAISGILLYIISWSTGIAIPISQIPDKSWFAIAYLVVFSSIVTFVAYLYALQHLPASRFHLRLYKPSGSRVDRQPIFRGKFSVYIGGGGIVTLFGVYLVNEAFRTKIPERVEEILEEGP